MLQIYLHFNEHQRYIREQMTEHELQFNLAHHRTLWRKILDLFTHEPGFEEREDDSLNSLRASCAHDEQLNQQLSYLLWLDENTRVALMRPKMAVRAAIANMELEVCQKRYRYWTQLCDKAYQDGETDLARMYQKLHSGGTQEDSNSAESRSTHLRRAGSGSAI